MNTVQYTATQELVDLYNGSKEVYAEDCPDFMNEKREAAINSFAEQGIPWRKVEDYKYTDLRQAFQNDFQVYPRYVKQKVDLHDIFNCDVPKLEATVVLTVNGWYYQRNKLVENLPEGVILGSLQEVANQHPELVEKYYGKLAPVDTDPFAALNTALVKDGVFLYVPENVTIEKPIQIINLLNSTDNTFVNQRNIFAIGKNAEAKVVFCDHTLNDKYYAANNLVECFVDDDARFSFYNIQNQHDEATNIASFYLDQGKNTVTNSGAVTLNGGIIRNNIGIDISGEHSEANVFGLSLLDGKQHADNFININHKVPECVSNQLFKNILDEEATGAFSGRIHVYRDAQKTSAFQRNNNVLMCERSTMNTKPQLVIDADDVRCSHGATIGRIDEDALFYLRARGIPEREARLMLMFAFANEVLDGISIEALRGRIEELVDRRLRGDLSPCNSCAVHCEQK